VQASVRYPEKRNRYASHTQIVNLCGPGDGRKLADIGCAAGVLTHRLSANGWDAIGVELDHNDAEIARSHGLAVVEQPAEDFFACNSAAFDTIVFADVLEHMTDPAAVLASARESLAPGGRIVISIPNVAHLSVRLGLLMGSFRYQDRGILDRTHLRFFTRASFVELVTGCGLDVVELRATPTPFEEAFPRLGDSALYAAVAPINAALANRWKTMFAYQFIAVATPR